MLIIKEIESLIGETIGLGYHIEGVITKPTSYEFLIQRDRVIQLPFMGGPKITKEERMITINRVNTALGGWVFYMDGKHLLTINTNTIRDKIGFIATLQEALRMVN